MHTTQIGDWVIHHNGSYDGDIEFTTPDKSRFSVPFYILENLVAASIRDDAINWWEGASTLEILKRKEES